MRSSFTLQQSMKDFENHFPDLPDAEERKRRTDAMAWIRMPSN
jgi:hypothetical protein